MALLILQGSSHTYQGHFKNTADNLLTIWLHKFTYKFNWMAPKTKKISLAKREKNIYITRGKTHSEVPRMLNMSLGAVHHILKKKKETGVEDN